MFLAGEISLPQLEKYRILDLLVVGNGGPLMLMCSNAQITGGFLFLVAHLMQLFGVSHRFETPIKGCRVMDSFILLVGFEFFVDVYG